MKNIINQFEIDGTAVSWEPYGEGHVNRTYSVVVDNGKRYILQRVSSTAFHDIPGLMDNVIRITQALSCQSNDPRSYLHLIPAHDGSFWIRDDEGEYWRIYEHIENTLCLQEAQTPEDFYQSGVAFGQFQYMLRDFPIDTLNETIVNFHNTPDRYRVFKEAIKEDKLGRASEVKKEIEFT